MNTNGNNNPPFELKDNRAVSFLYDDIKCLKGVGDKLREAFAKHKIFKIYDLIFTFPFRYEVLNTKIYDGKGVLSGIYEGSGTTRTRKGKTILKAVFRAERGFITGVWLNARGNYPVEALKQGEKYYLYGNVTHFEGSQSIFHPEFINEKELGSVRPIYSLPAPISQPTYKKIVSLALKDYLSSVNETIPKYLLDKYGFPEIKDAIKTLHSPETEENATSISSREHSAFLRFIYEEFFYLQLALQVKRKNYSHQRGISFKIERDFLDKIKEMMPFKLTNAQRKVIVEVFNDMISEKQMNRLIQGDVGSGKTILAFIAGLVAIENGYQVIFIAPTEVLAEQHFNNLIKNFKYDKLKPCLITGSVSNKDKVQTKQLIASGAINFIIGTHAILEDNVGFDNLGLVIIDEQHRFGVHQRKVLMNKGFAPDVLLMTATPIPRTLAMTLYGDLDVSVVGELPPGRLPAITKAYNSKKLNEALDFVKVLLDKGGRAYFIYPLISESDKLDLKAATESYEYIKRYYHNKNIGLLHGKMKADEKRELLDGFKSGKIDILVSTTVVEVGVDVPEATVILIENAERFGLSQLHQLRGRVGRNNIQSYCILVTSPDISEVGKKRIEAMIKYTDGFKLAEVDLEIRGQGDFFGTKQSGIPEFKFADILKDFTILQNAKKDATDIIDSDENFETEENRVIKERFKELYGGVVSYLSVG